MYKTNCNYS